MTKINDKLIKNNLKYIILICIAFSLVWYEYGIKTALLGFVLLSSIFFLLINLVKVYQYLKQRSYKYFFPNLIGVVFFSTIIYCLPDRLTRFAMAFCIILFVTYVIYDLIRNKEN